MTEKTEIGAPAFVEHKAYGYYANQNGYCHYVAQLPGQGGVDWGYTRNAPSSALTAHCLDQPLLLSTYWQRRFKADMRVMQRAASFVTHVRD